MAGRVTIPRRKCRVVNIADIAVGGDNTISVQSMTKTDTRDAKATLEQTRALAEAGCEIIRCAVPDEEAALALKAIVNDSPIPVVADIHFSYKLAMMSIEAGVHKLRLNPGNIRSKEKTAEIVKACKYQGIPIRIGINAGSLDKELLKRDGWASPEAMVDSALGHIELLENLNFSDILISLKATDAPRTFRAYQILAEKCDYPFHLGITEAGYGEEGLIKSSVGLGALLLQGMGDTIRVSLTDDPVKEVTAGFSILQSAGLRNTGIEFVSCPTCGRIEVDLRPIADQVKERLKHLKVPMTIAVMGCTVNGPGESREADLGFCGGKGKGAIYKKGKLLRTVDEEHAVDVLVSEALKLADQNSKAG